MFNKIMSALIIVFIVAGLAWLMLATLTGVANIILGYFGLQLLNMRIMLCIICLVGLLKWLFS